MAEFEQKQIYLRHALTLAQQGRGACAPNPAVGAVVVKNKQIIATGYHSAYGQAHAEQEALLTLSQQQAQGAVVYVTLEPCSHWGKTPPCTSLLVEKGVQAVYYGYKDSNPIMQHSGQSILQQHGIDCQHLPLPEIEQFYHSYQHWLTHHKPWVTLKLALSLDGKIGHQDNQSVAITGQEIQRYTHQQRCLSDAILTTARTINIDNPQLNVRIEQNSTLAKSIYIIDTSISLDHDAQIFQTAKELVVFHAMAADPVKRQQLIDRGVECVAIQSTQQGLDIAMIIDHIGKDGIHDLWIEAGGELAQSFLENNLVNQGLFYIAPKWLGSSYKTAFNDFSQDVFGRAKCYNWLPFGDDTLLDIKF